MADETPNPESEILNEYTLSLNEKRYLLHISIKEEYLIFICTPIEKKPQFYYIYKCTLNSLRKMSKAFHLYHNLTEVLYLFEELNKNKLVSLEIGDDDNLNNSDNESFSISNYKKNENSYEFINLVIKLFVLVKEETMVFPLEKKQIKDNNKTINNLKNEINKISEDFNNIEIKYEKKIESLKKEVKLLRNENTTFKNQITELINKIDELKNILNKNNNKNNMNSIQDLIKRVEKLEEWKNDTSFSNKNLMLNNNDSKQVKNENKINNKEETNNKIENNNNNKKLDKEDDKCLSNENNKEDLKEEEENEEIEEKEEGKEIIYIDKKENNSEISFIEEEEEEEEDDDDEEEKEINNTNKESFMINFKNKDMLLKSLISQSNIISKNDEIEFILNKIMKLNPISFTLLYKGTQDKDDSKIFHQKCDNNPNILLFILTDKNYIFGGYTSIGFDNSGNAKKDNESFLFSVDMKKIYEIKEDSYAIFCNKNCGPIFCGKSDGLYNICIPDKYFRYKCSTTKKGIPFNTTEPFELNHGEKEFKVSELEVFKIEKH